MEDHSMRADRPAPTGLDPWPRAQAGEDSTWEALFSTLPDLGPAPGFSSRVLAARRLEEARARRRRRAGMRWAALVAGVPAGVAWLAAPVWLAPVGRALGPASWAEAGAWLVAAGADAVAGLGVAVQGLASLQEVLTRLAATPEVAGSLAAAVMVAFLALRGLSGALVSGEGEKGVGHA